MHNSMNGAMRFPCKENNHGKGLLILYILHTLQRSPKSGYEILNEIKEKTEGRWVPSKGTIYPSLTQLEKKRLIKVVGVEKRSKKIFSITPQGKELLHQFRKRSGFARKKFEMVRGLLVEVLGVSRVEKRLYEVWEGAMKAYEKDKIRTIKVLEECISDLGEIYGRD